MDRQQITTRLDDIIDELADIEHERWAHWQRYMHGKCEHRPDGALVIPPNLVTKWERQIATPYFELSEKEKESDREQVRKYLLTIVDALSDP
ncbi:hypothetical protein FIU94_11280 [Sulfitobacter sp. THAF37]|jgi:hypothetical protein|uniref:RyR domain-containing protein n=1 Tax=Sulfitobacter sp. THAF37 TaxID=2587855 RepID=UPI001267FEF8|nr:RyR domain-containing protein [Sulfitobacter sp. THAF37]QFT59405.1 hypothetical protein FIU94_11280 [Sulfitobacter sp. THAF37]